MSTSGGLLPLAAGRPLGPDVQFPGSAPLRPLAASCALLLLFWGGVIARGPGDVTLPGTAEVVSREVVSREVLGAAGLLRHVAGALPRAGTVILARFRPAVPGAPVPWTVVEVDGKLLRAAPDAGGVELALAAAGVHLDEADRLLVVPNEAPAAGARAGGSADGRVVVQRAVPFFVVDSGLRIGLRAAAGTVGEALGVAGIDVHSADGLLPAGETPLVPGLTVAIWRATPVAILDHDVHVETRTRAATVSELLAEHHLQPGPLDRVEPPLDAPVPLRGTVRVVRIREETGTELQVVPFHTRLHSRPDLPPGARWRVQEGLPGLVERLVRVRYEDGNEVSRTLVQQATVRPAVDEVIAVGPDVAKLIPAPPSDAPAPLPQIPPREAPAGPVPPVTLPDGAAVRRTLAVVATAYDPGPVSTGKSPGHPAYGITATGMRAGRGVVAVDPRVIPFYTRLYVPDYGYAVAGDTGRAIKGNRIDVGFPTYDEAVRWGRRSLTVYILE